MNIYQKKLQYIELPCGQGKSTLMTSIIESNPDKHYLVVVPSKQLQRQSRDNVGTGLVINHETHDDLLATIIAHLHSMNERVLYITDKMFWRIDDLTILKNWTIFLDDCVDYFLNDDAEISLDDGSLPSELYAQLFDLVSYQSGYTYVTLSKNKLSDDLNRVRDRYKKFQYYKNICVNAEVFTSDYCKHLYIVGYHELFKYYDTGIDMIFMAANFTQSLIYKKFHKVFSEYSHDILPNTTNNSRLKIIYFMKNRTLSAKLLDDHPEITEKIGQYINSQNHNNLLWTCNEKRKEEWGVIGNYITPCQRGINNYTSYTVAAFLSSMKINPAMVKMIQDVLGHSRNDIVQQREYEACYQFVYRTNLRDYNSSENIVLYVVDEVTARSIPGATIEYIDIGVDIKKKKTGPKPKFLEPKTRKLFKQYLSRGKRNLTDIFDWIKDKKLSNVQKDEIYYLYNDYLKTFAV